MSRKAFVSVQEIFAEEAGSTFSFLGEEFGLSGPAYDDLVLLTVTFTSPVARYSVMLDPADKLVLTQVAMDVGAKTLVADLADLVQAAELGSPGVVSQSAYTLTGLRKALSSQAGYLRLIHLRVEAESALALLRAAGAREWNRRQNQ